MMSHPHYEDELEELTQCLCGTYVPYMLRPPTQHFVQDLDFGLRRDEFIAFSKRRDIYSDRV